MVFNFFFIPLVLADVYNPYVTSDLFTQQQYNIFNPYTGGGLFNPMFSGVTSPFGWPQYGTVNPWSNGGLFGLTRASGQSDRYGGNLGYNYGCLFGCQLGGLLGR